MNYNIFGVLIKYGNIQDNDISELQKRHSIGYRCEYVLCYVIWYQEENVTINRIEDL